MDAGVVAAIVASVVAVLVAAAGLIGTLMSVSSRFTALKGQHEALTARVARVEGEATSKDEHEALAARVARAEKATEGFMPHDILERMRELDRRTYDDGRTVGQLARGFDDYVKAQEKRFHDMRDHFAGSLGTIQTTVREMSRTMEKLGDKLDATLLAFSGSTPPQKR